MGELASRLQPIGIDDDFFSLGGNSLLAAGMFVQIEQESGRQLAFDMLLEAPTVRLLAQRLATARPRRQSPLVMIQPGSSRPTLFCLPCIASSLLEFRDLARRLGPTYPVVGFRPPGVDGRETPYSDVAEMATDYVESMRKMQPEGPYYLAGYSFGGVVAFEMAQQLRANGQSVGLLALLDSYLAPKRASLREKIADHWKLSGRQPDTTRWGYVFSRVRARIGNRFHRAGPVSDEQRILEMDLPPARRKVASSHLRAWKAYQPKVYHGILTLFIAAGRTAEEWRMFRDRYLGWSRWTLDPIDACQIPGTHTSILNSENVPALARLLAARINASQVEALHDPIHSARGQNA